MLFNSFEFLFAFLPVTLALYHGFRAARCKRTAILTLTAASLAFYAWWNWANTLILVGSVAFNFVVGRAMSRSLAYAGVLLALGVAGNLLLLGYFKYWNFFAYNFNALAPVQLPHLEIALPLGISFFTFTQIAFLVDTRRSLAREYSPVRYALFASYFPHLIAGPIIHHRQLIPQFDRQFTTSAKLDAFNLGLVVFLLGLAKKVLLADSLAAYANPVFDAAAASRPLEAPVAWMGVLAYTLQLYFDFSGYSDMAVGLSKMFGVNLPINFNTPYRAESIVDFWRRWHMTLSAFLRQYLYIPLGGSRRGALRRYGNLLVTMVLGGLWHGAGWTFLIWGGIHGAALALNHLWREHAPAIWTRAPHAVRGPIAWLATFAVIVVGWVYFRSADVATAHRIIEAMFNARTTDWEVFGTLIRQSLATFRSQGWIESLLLVLEPSSSLLPKYAVLPSMYGAFLIPALLSGAIFGPSALSLACSIRRWCRDGSVAMMLAGYTSLVVLAIIFFACLARLNNATDFLYYQF